METGDAPTVQPLADEYREEVGADLLILTGRSGAVLGTAGLNAGDIPELLPNLPLESEDEICVLPHRRGLLQVVSAPIFLEGPCPTFSVASRSACCWTIGWPGIQEAHGE